MPEARVRDPARKERILAAAADLLAGRGFHAVAMADIGAAAGITGSGIYRHFDSKSAVLVALFDRVINELLQNAATIVHESADERETLARLVGDQVRIVSGEREIMRVYYTEIHNLPDEDRRRLRRKQRLYLEEWVHVLGELRPSLSDTETRTIVHAAIGAIQSILFHDSGLPPAHLKSIMTTSAHAVLQGGPNGMSAGNHICGEST